MIPCFESLLLRTYNIDDLTSFIWINNYNFCNKLHSGYLSYEGWYLLGATFHISIHTCICCEIHIWNTYFLHFLHKIQFEYFVNWDYSKNRKTIQINLYKSKYHSNFTRSTFKQNSFIFVLLTKWNHKFISDVVVLNIDNETKLTFKTHVYVHFMWKKNVTV